MCSAVKPRIRELAIKDERLVGPLAVEILLALYDGKELLTGTQHVFGHVFSLLTTVLEQLKLHNARFRANLACALVRLNPEKHNPADEQSHGPDSVQQILRRLFGLGE